MKIFSKHAWRETAGLIARRREMCIRIRMNERFHDQYYWCSNYSSLIHTCFYIKNELDGPRTRVVHHVLIECVCQIAIIAFLAEFVATQPVHFERT